MDSSADLIKKLSFERRFTWEVKVGNIGIGGNNPIRIQSMTNTDTMDTEKTVSQAIRMVDAGCELVRITAVEKVPTLVRSTKKSILKNKAGIATIIPVMMVAKDGVLYLGWIVANLFQSKPSRLMVIQIRG